MKYILIRYGELTLKGKNRFEFERRLLNNIKNQLQDYDLKIKKDRNRIYIEKVDAHIIEEVSDILKNVPGVHSFAIADICEPTLQAIKDVALENFDRSKPEFRVTVKRLDKQFEMMSDAIQREVGAHLLINNDGLEGLKVKLKKPEQEIKIEIHKDAAYVFSKHILAIGGLPIKSSGRAVVLLSGGIDSPVAAILAMKRGLKVTLCHFSSPPYTTEKALEKVLDLTRELQKFDKSIKLFNFKVTDLQVEINKACKDSMQVVLLRRMMLRIIDNYFDRIPNRTIVTGENLAQVASQTLESMYVTNSTTPSLILRPLLTYDKQEIIELAIKYNTYDISIRPYDDCCVMFLPKNPATQPKMDVVIAEESKLDYMTFIENIECEIYDYKKLHEENEEINEYITI